MKYWLLQMSWWFLSVDVLCLCGKHCPAVDLLMIQSLIIATSPQLICLKLIPYRPARSS